MANDSPPKLRISLWRNLRPVRTLAYKAGDATDARFFQRDDQLQEEVFAWHVGESALNGVVDDVLMAKITACLTDDFAPALPPADRACRRLEKFFEAARDAIESGKAEWSNSEDPAIMEYLKNGGTLETTAAKASHASTRMPKLYNHGSGELKRERF